MDLSAADLCMGAKSKESDNQISSICGNEMLRFPSALHAPFTLRSVFAHCLLCIGLVFARFMPGTSRTTRLNQSKESVNEHGPDIPHVKSSAADLCMGAKRNESDNQISSICENEMLHLPLALHVPFTFCFVFAHCSLCNGLVFARFMPWTPRDTVFPFFPFLKI